MWASPPGPSYLPNLRHDPWGIISFGARAVGFLLLFVSALVIIAGVSIPASCYSAAGSCTGTTWAGLVNALLVGRIIAAIGLASLGFGAAVKLHYGLRTTNATTGEEARVVASERQVEGALFVASVILLLVLALSVNVFPGLPGVTGLGL